MILAGAVSADPRPTGTPDGCRALGVLVALVSLVEEDRQVFPGACGCRRRSTPSGRHRLRTPLCQHVVADQRPLVVSDAREHDRVRDNPRSATSQWWRTPVGPSPTTLARSSGRSAIDHEPRAWTSADPRCSRTRRRLLD